jgi:uncharacterized protein HemY
MSNDQLNSQIDQLRAAVRDQDGPAARKAMEDIAETNPAAAQTLLTGLINKGNSRRK